MHYNDIVTTMKGNIMEPIVETETTEETSKIKSFAKKYWKPVAAGAALTAVVVATVARIRNSDEDETFEGTIAWTPDSLPSADSPEQ